MAENSKRFKKGQIPWNKGLKGFMAGRVVSMETRLKSSLSQRGDKNHAWRGGKTPKSYKHTFEYSIWRERILSRDKCECQICGRFSFYPVAHHIKASSLFPELMYEIENGITLCYECHMLVHKVSFYRLKQGEFSETLKQATLSQVWKETYEKVQRLMAEAKNDKTFMPVIANTSPLRESDEIV